LPPVFPYSPTRPRGVAEGIRGDPPASKVSRSAKLRDNSRRDGTTIPKEAVRNPFPQEKWDAFLAMSPWFNRNRRYLRDQVQQFRDTNKLAVATYGVVQAEAMVRNIQPDKQPWLLNSVYSNRTVQEHEDGSAGRNQAWFKDFRALQRQRDHRPIQTGETAT
jgi:hypothetical protein